MVIWSPQPVCRAAWLASAELLSCTRANASEDIARR